MRWLDSVFEHGAAYSFGKLNADCWHLYTINPLRGGVASADQTFELLMTDLDPEVMSCFYKSVSEDGKMATKVTVFMFHNCFVYSCFTNLAQSGGHKVLGLVLTDLTLELSAHD